MKVTPIKTEVVHAFSSDITKILSQSLNNVSENSIIAITSKIISLCEGNVVKMNSVCKDDLIEKEASFFLPKNDNKYGVYLTIKNNAFIPNSGIDESNTGGYYVLWPKNPYLSAQICRNYIKDHFNLKNVGVIITDSTTTPLKWGVTGISIAHAGFHSLNDKVSKSDLFGKKLEMTKVNVADALAASAVLCMGEADEQTPIALLEDIPFVEFSQNAPSFEEINMGQINIEDDMYGQLLKTAPWVTRNE